MDLTDFQILLGDFLVDMLGMPVKALVDLWNEETTQAIVMIVTRCPLLGRRPKSAHRRKWTALHPMQSFYYTLIEIYHPLI